MSVTDSTHLELFGEINTAILKKQLH